MSCSMSRRKSVHGVTAFPMSLHAVNITDRQADRQTEREISGVERLQLELRGGNEEGGHECGQCGVSFVYGELDDSLGVKTTDRVFKKNSWFSSSNLQANK